MDRKFRPFGRNFRWAEIPAFGRKFQPSGKSAKSFLGSLSGGVPELLPGSSPGNIRRSGSSDLLAGSSGPGKFPVEFWLSHFGFSSREGSRRFWAEFLPGDFRPTGSSGVLTRSCGPRPEFPVHNTGISEPSLFQRPDFLEGYKYPSPYLGSLSFFTLSPQLML